MPMGQSKSMDNSIPRVNGSVRQDRVLATSRSESALKNLQGVKVAAAITRTGSGKSLSTMGEENSAGEESTDNASSPQNGGPVVVEKKKKKKLLSRLLKPGSDKKSS